MAKPPAIVCGVPVRLGGAVVYGVELKPSDAVPKAKGITRAHPLSKPGAKRLAAALGRKHPRVGTQIELCPGTRLVNRSGTFYVDIDDE